MLLFSPCNGYGQMAQELCISESDRTSFTTKTHSMRYTMFFLLSMGLLLSSFSGKRGLVVTSPGFAENGRIPERYSCDGIETNPPLHIDNIPVGAKSLAIIVHDPDAEWSGGFTHWVAWDIPVTNNIPENFKGGTSGVNSYIQHNYKGMCPPAGPHHYHFYVYALDKWMKADLNTDKDGLEEKMRVGRSLREAR
jgi:Raf kinase inhibitor-like YbhB/YbcL family protein